MLVEEDTLRPLPEAVLNEGLHIPMAIMGEDHVGPSIARRSVDVLPGREFDPVARLSLEVGEEVVVETSVLRSHHRREANEGSSRYGSLVGRRGPSLAVRTLTGVLVAGYQRSAQSYCARRATEELQEAASAHAARRIFFRQLGGTALRRAQHLDPLGPLADAPGK